MPTLIFQYFLFENMSKYAVNIWYGVHTHYQEKYIAVPKNT